MPDDQKPNPHDLTEAEVLKLSPADRKAYRLAMNGHPNPKYDHEAKPEPKDEEG